jgi:hypothetical protein
MRFWRPRRPARAVKPAYPTRLRLERLEDRCVPSIDMVTNLSGSASVSGSLPYWVAHAASGDTIQFAAGLSGTITLGNTLDINKNLTIDGAGHGITVNGGGNRVFQIDSGVVADINALTITGGVSPVLGGAGIANSGSLSLSNSTLTGNAAHDGGGIFNGTGATMTMSGDTVNNNTATDAAGGIANLGKLTIINCTIATNQALYAGGIDNFPAGVLNVVNSTVASNTVTGAVSEGGGILTNSAMGAQLSLLNTIVYNPNSGATTHNDVLGTITQAEGDLFGPGPVVVAPGGDHGGGNYGANPQLGPLQNNGGPTATMALLPGSPAIGHGVSTSHIPGLTVPTTDQRGDPRPAGSIDIGAYQVQVPPPPFNPPWQGLGGSVTQLTAVTDPNGDLEVFGIGLDHAVWVNVQTSPNGAFGGWFSLSGTVKQINVATNADGTLELFAIGSGNGAWFQQQFKNGSALSWSGWLSAGGYARQLDSARDGNGNLELFAIGYDHGVWVNSQTSPEGALGGWSSLGGYVKQITVGANSNGALQVFGIGANNAAWFCEQQAGSWSSWYSLGGYAKQLKVGRDLNNDLELFAIGANDAVWVDSQTAPGGGFGGWTSLGGSVSQIAVGTGNNGDLFVFGISGGHATSYRKQHSATNLAWDNWLSLGGDATQLTTANQANEHLDLFAISGSNAPWFRDVNV